MTLKDLIFLQVVPHDLYFEWQLEVQIVNFRKFGISDQMHILVWHPVNSNRLGEWVKLKKKYPEVNLYLYQDTGVNLKLYISQLRPHTLKKYFRAFSEKLKDKVFFYHDSDILFRELPDFEKLMNDNICWQSDTSSYLDYSYLRTVEKRGKIDEDYAVKILADIGGVTVDKFKEYDKRTGGAQYILKGIDADFWEDVERMCIEIRQKFSYHINGSVNWYFFNSENEGFQSWCADMWAINMAMWKRGMQTEITPLLDFSWATDKIETYYKKPIFHNAGATGKEPGIFYKGAWIKESPLYKTHDVDPQMASSKYVEAISEVINK